MRDRLAALFTWLLCWLNPNDCCGCDWETDDDD